MACGNNDYLDMSQLLNRREMFSRVGTGLTGIALSSLLADEVAAMGQKAQNKLIQRPHHRPKATAVIQLFQHGGPSHMDLLDPKPVLNQQDGKPMPKEFDDLVKLTKHGGLMGTPYKFHRAGECGVEYSEILPHTAQCADDIAIVRSMFSEHNNHEQALWHMHTGRTVSGRPTIGAWVNFALGSENKNLPAYVVLRNDNSLPVDGTRNWSAGFLPPRYQGVHFRNSGTPVLHLEPSKEISKELQDLRFELLKKVNSRHKQENPSLDAELEARIASYELAGRMQLTAAEALDVSAESKATQEMYGLNNPKCASYGKRCLMARRLVERGVRYVQILIRGQMWDTHSDNAKRTKECCLETDQPAAALLRDLKQRGLLDSTLVFWGGEFGRTPVSQGGAGRDHHKQGFSLWLAGGGIKGGQAYGATDDFGYYVTENKTPVADLHATILHLLGLNDKRLVYHKNGLEERLTSIHDAHVIQPLIA